MIFILHTVSNITASQRRGSFRGGMPGRNMNRGGGGGREPPAHYGPSTLNLCLSLFDVV